jgi:hypothetical protein
MKRAAATIASRNKGAEFEGPASVFLAVALSAGPLRDAARARRHLEELAATSSGQGQGGATNVGEMTGAQLISLMTAALVTLLVQATLAFEKCRFNNGFILGTALAAVNWYEATARRKGLRASRVTLILIATSAAALTLVLQQAAHLFATSLPQSITHS